MHIYVYNCFLNGDRTQAIVHARVVLYSKINIKVEEPKAADH